MGRVFVTGMGVVSSLGFGKKAYWDALVAGRSGISPVTLFDTAQIGRHVAGEVKGFRSRDFLTAASIAWKHNGSNEIRHSMKSTSARRPTREYVRRMRSADDSHVLTSPSNSAAALRCSSAGSRRKAGSSR